MPLSQVVEGSKPNIVIIFTDDQGYGDLSCYGSTTIRTPRLDKLASEGTRFTSFYVQPVCGPSRSALLTGRYPARSKGWEMPASEITFAERLKTAGYTTCCIGKWDVSSRRPIVPRMPNAKGFDYYWGPLGANDRGLVRLWENNTNIGEDKDMASLTRTYTDKACEWLEEHVAQNSKQEADETGRKPFLLYLAHTMPHTIIDASPAFKNRSGNGLYADTIEELDHECGRLLDTIDRLGLRNDTLVIFTTDNGPWCNDQERQHRKQEARVSRDQDHPFRGAKVLSTPGAVLGRCARAKARTTRAASASPASCVGRGAFRQVALPMRSSPASISCRPSVHSPGIRSRPTG